MIKRYIDWKEFSGHVQEIARKIAVSGWRPDVIVGITRGGALPAVMLSHYFECKMVTVDVALRDNKDSEWTMGPESNCWLPEDATKGCKILIVDDINDSGATLNWIKKDWESSVGQSELTWGDGIRIATLFDKSSSKSELYVDYCSEEIDVGEDDPWLVFPYEEFWKL